MNDQPETRIEKKIFARALELPAAERAAFIKRACDGDDDLRTRIEALLASHDDDSRFLEEPAMEVNLAAVASWANPDEFLIGERIGGWTIDCVIAAGGMGTVYQASGGDNGDTVAIKLMRAGIASRGAMRRFQFEAQILSRLDHPGIAHVLETGTHDDGSGGVPFFVMEYVPHAQPITQYADEHDLDLRERLALFAQVCDAVHYGHQKGVIHRDLKPANMLVDPSGRPKIIDFGVARATDSDLAVTTIATSAGDLLGTLQYMSPEQCGTDPGAVDVRSDIYSLGVVLYELICGDVPYDVREVGVLEAVRRIRESKPRNPREVKPTVAADVATIALKALEKEPERRYQSAAELATDLRRFLNHLPVAARPPSQLYRARKFIARNRSLSAAAMMIFLLLIGGTVLSTILAVRATRAQKEAADRFQRLHDYSKTLIFDLYDAMAELPGSTPARELLVRRGLEILEMLLADAGDDPELLYDIATGYLRISDVQGSTLQANLGDIESARNSISYALAIVERLHEWNPQSRAVRHLLAQALIRRANLGHPDQSGSYGEETDWHVRQQRAFDILAELAEETNDPQVTIDLAISFLRRGIVTARHFDLEDGLAMLERGRALALHVQDSHARHQAQRVAAEIAYFIGEVYRIEGHADLARPWWERALMEFDALVAEDPSSTFLRGRLNGAIMELAMYEALEGDPDRAVSQLHLMLDEVRQRSEIDPTNQRAFRAVETFVTAAADLHEQLAQRFSVDSRRAAQHLQQAEKCYLEAQARVQERVARGWLPEWESHYPGEYEKALAAVRSQLQRLTASTQRVEADG